MRSSGRATSRPTKVHGISCSARNSSSAARPSRDYPGLGELHFKASYTIACATPCSFLRLFVGGLFGRKRPRATTRGRRSSVERLRIALEREIAQHPGVAVLSVQEYAQACRHVGVDSLPFHDLSIQFAKNFRLQRQVGANPFPVARAVMRWRLSKPRPRAQVRENPPECVRLVRLIFGQTFEPCLDIRIGT